MSFYIVPNELRDEINRRIDTALAGMPPEVDLDRDEAFETLFAFFMQHGVIPEFSISKRSDQ